MNLFTLNDKRFFLSDLNDFLINKYKRKLYMIKHKTNNENKKILKYSNVQFKYLFFRKVFYVW